MELLLSVTWIVLGRRSFWSSANSVTDHHGGLVLAYRRQRLESMAFMEHDRLDFDHNGTPTNHRIILPCHGGSSVVKVACYMEKRNIGYGL